MNKKIPNILTVLRIFLVPGFPLIYFSDLPKASYYSLAFFLIVGATDILDGYIARKYNLISAFGTAMDPLADKLMLIAVLVAFGIKGILPLWVIVFIVVKEFLMIIAGLYFYFKREKYVIPSNIFGKTATMLIFLAILGILIRPEFVVFVYMIYLAVCLKIVALFFYTKGHLRNIKNTYTEN